MSGLLSFLVSVLVLATAIQQRALGLAVCAAILFGMYVGRWGTMAYRRGEIVNLKRELAAQREWDEEDTP